MDIYMPFFVVGRSPFSTNSINNRIGAKKKAILLPTIPKLLSKPLQSVGSDMHR
jgi:hypothetical protein